MTCAALACLCSPAPVNPNHLADTPQKAVRHAVLRSGKTLLTPQPRLRTGFFSTLHADAIPPDALMEACTSGGQLRAVLRCGLLWAAPSCAVAVAGRQTRCCGLASEVVGAAPPRFMMRCADLLSMHALVMPPSASTTCLHSDAHTRFSPRQLEWSSMASRLAWTTG